LNRDALNPTENQNSTFCDDYTGRCPADRPETLKDLEKCDQDECEEALSSLWWRCYHAETAQGAASKLPGSWNRTSSNVCYGVQKAAFATDTIEVTPDEESG